MHDIPVHEDDFTALYFNLHVSCFYVIQNALQRKLNTTT